MKTRNGESPRLYPDQEIGFANISMSKIAKATGLSAATLYVYYENKEDMHNQYQ